MTSEQIQNLQPNSDYQFNLYSQRNGIRAQASLTVLPPVVTPPENTIVAIDDRGEDFINIVWDHDPTQGIISYHPTLLRNDGVTLVQDGGLIGAPAGAAPLSHRFTGLNPGTQYTFDINVVASANPTTEIDYASDLAFTRPKPPNNVLLYPLTPTTILFTWERPLPPNDFFIDYVVSASNVDLGFSVQNVLPQGATSNAIRGLQPATSYDLSVLTNIEPVTSNFPAFTDVPLINGMVSELASLTVLPPVVTPPENTIVAIDDRGEDFINIVWDHDPTQGIISYHPTLLRNDGVTLVQDGGLIGAPAGAAPLSHRFTGLNPGTQYTFDINVVASANPTTEIDYASDLAFTRPKPPNNILLYPLNPTTILFTWERPLPPNDFFIDYVVSASNVDLGFSVQNILPQGATSNAIRGLQPATSYDLSVLTNIEPVTSNFPAFTDVPLTAVAGTVNIGAVTAQELEVLWSTDGIAADSFRVLLFSEDGLQQYEKSVPAGTTSVLFENLTPDTPYIAVVEAIVRNVLTNTDQASVVGSDEATTSKNCRFRFRSILLIHVKKNKKFAVHWQEQITILAIYRKPSLDTYSAVAGTVNIGAVTAQELEVLWSTDGIAADSFRVLLFSEDGLEQFEQSVPAGTTSVLFENLTPDTPYIAVVEAIVRNVLTNTDQASVVGSDEATTNSLPGTNSVTVDSTTGNSATLSWTFNQAATDYVISYISADGSHTGAFNPDGNGNTAVVVPGLQPQTTYTFSVLGTDGTNTFNVGSAVGTTGLDTTVTLDSVTENTVTLSWTAIDGSTFYQVLYRPTGSTQPEQQMIVSNGPQNSQTTLTGLTPATMYDVRVVAFPGGAPLEVGSITPTTGIFNHDIRPFIFPCKSEGYVNGSW
nr:fibronectin-like [Lytechinus pictus]